MAAKPLPAPEVVAAEFVKVLRRWIKKPGLLDGDYAGLTPAKAWAKMCANNAAQPEGSSCCCSHDWCDANMAMDEAMRNLGINPLGGRGGHMSQRVTDLWNASWTAAMPALSGKVKS